MTIIIFGIFFIIIWLVTTFLIIRYIKKVKNDLLKKFSDTEKPSKTENEEKGDGSFDFIKGADPEKLLFFIQNEHPQIIALILANLEPAMASTIMEKLPFELLGDVSVRIGTLDRVSSEIIREIERVLEKKLSTLSSEDYFAVGGVESIVDILHCVDRDREKKLLKLLKAKTTNLRKK